MIKNLKKLREQYKLSQQDLAELLGVTQQAIYKYEKTPVEPSISMLIQMSQILHTTVDYLVGNTENEEKDGDFRLSSDEKNMIVALRTQKVQTQEAVFRIVEELAKK